MTDANTNIAIWSSALTTFAAFAIMLSCCEVKPQVMEWLAKVGDWGHRRDEVDLG